MEELLREFTVAFSLRLDAGEYPVSAAIEDVLNYALQTFTARECEEWISLQPDRVAVLRRNEEGEWVEVHSAPLF